ncbi:GNAT family N-acetyltransferase [Roseobacter fucihabitans]|uniref:GNAT family N-acetyltransferase n=1 Tax=Roseobacter fucihabitans TaxID=1537242 RepID=UPI001652BC31|nr:GNAT family N-acetyltransferase [Roseobacter litoralis]
MAQKNVEIRHSDAQSPQSVMLFSAAYEAMQSLYPNTQKAAFSMEPLRAIGVKILLAFCDESPAGCCAVFEQKGYSEVKRLFVFPEMRGFGIAEGLLEEVEAVARRSHSKKVMLESGTQLLAAHRLYLRRGYERRAAFDGHEDLPESLFFEKRLDP